MIRTNWLTTATAVVALTAVSLAQAPTPAQAPVPGTPDDVRAFAGALETCTAAKVATPHPLMKSFTIEHTVVGAKDTACLYTQTMPGKMMMECGFSATGRKAMATDLRAALEGGALRGGTSQAQPEWAKECELVTASGARSPMVRIK